MLRPSKRTSAIKPSATIAMAARARQMLDSGIDVISFATGEPDFDTPSFIKEAAKKSLDAGKTKYPPSAGIPELKRAISEKLARDNGLSYSEREIVVTCGAKQAIANALLSLVDDGDEVIIPSPYWVSYPEQIKLAGGKPIVIQTSSNTCFKLTPDLLERVITPKTKALILNTPANPTGSAYTKEELLALARILVGHNIAVISDEIYEKLVYDGFPHTSIVKAYPPIKELSIIINGVSKSYAMTGWRMGYAAGPHTLIEKMTALIEQQISGIPLFIQAACVDALTKGSDDVEHMRREFETRRNLLFKHVTAIPGIHCHLPDGAFYLLPNIEAHIGKSWNKNKINDATLFASFLLEEAHVATISGDPFGAPGHIRLSYATSRKNIEKGTERIRNALSKLK